MCNVTWRFFRHLVNDVVTMNLFFIFLFFVVLLSLLLCRELQSLTAPRLLVRT